ncbi:hypothetical protein OEZ85_001947 [Tetradesmus obliquus]|uniref:GPI inositol-deacylase n=1 Tax=Tetradesmus obliquus TaxID=3088 RepID=A0ABY8U493_TETOB|nr:hypothetical protein OEZ85_001947 [Tetradesmus obliquus]
MQLPSRFQCCAEVTSSSGNNSSSSRSPVLILPGFLSNNTTSATSQYRELADNLLQLGHPAAEILPASTWDWLPTLSGGSFGWYVERLAEAVQRLQAKHQQQISLVGISAGGWLARLALGSEPYAGKVWGLAPSVHTLVTCGTPHHSLEAYPFGRAEETWLVDQPQDAQMEAAALQEASTRSSSSSSSSSSSRITTSLQYANHHYPDASSLQPTRIVCVIGSAVTGKRVELAEVLKLRMSVADANYAWFVQSSYQANCGQVEVDGDGVCPVQTGLLPGAEQLVLPGVWHNAEPGKLWYGSQQVVPLWDSFLP